MLRSVFKGLRRFHRETSGAVALLFALAVIPLSLAAGIAIDVAEISKAKVKLQGAADAAALAAASVKGIDDNARIAIAKSYIDANLAGQPVGAVGAPVVSVGQGALTVEINSKMPARFMQLAGFNQHDLFSKSTVAIPGESNAEIALVLDYSGSMNGKGKYQAMRDAASSMVDILTDEGKNTDSIKFGLVPFSHHVYLSLPGEYVVDEAPGTTWTNCTQDRKYPHNVEDKAPVASNIDSLWGMSKTNGYGVGAYAVCKAYPRNNLVVKPLTNDADAIKTQLASMKPHSLTHIALGTEFGWALLSPQPPFTEAAPYSDKETKKYMVILTDGVQTEKAWGENKSHTVVNGEVNLEEMCANIKAEGIHIITIAFDLNDGWTENRLKGCATSLEDFHIADNNDQLANVFEEIAQKLFRVVRILK